MYLHLVQYNIYKNTSALDMGPLIEVTPVEYSANNIKRYFGYKIANFDAHELMQVILKMNVKVIPNIWDEDDEVNYQYPKYPEIVVKEGKLYTAEETWCGREFSQKQIRHQASFLLRILKDCGLADYKKRTTISRKKFVPYNFRE